MDQYLKSLSAELDQLAAVELLEYHDKNWLAGSNATRSEERMRRLERCGSLVNQMREHLSPVTRDAARSG